MDRKLMEKADKDDWWPW